MNSVPSIDWTNKSVKSFARNVDPVEAVENAARALVLEARQGGWDGPPFNPLHIAKMLGASVEPNSSIADARLLETESGPKIEFNPLQPRARLRFSIAHEVAHLLFEDWYEEVRNRGKQKGTEDDWQLELLCNLAASEFVLPIGSLSSATTVPSIEELMCLRRDHDVSTEAFLIRLARIATTPVGVFFASPIALSSGERRYRVDYFVSSPTAPDLRIAGKQIPSHSVVGNCIAVGYTDKGYEDWLFGADIQIECVGIPPYPGNVYPRVASLIRFVNSDRSRSPVSLAHGNVLEPRGSGPKILCQLVNDRARKWGGGVARKAAARFPDAEAEFARCIVEIPRDDRLGRVIFARASNDMVIGSMIAQEGFGPSLFPRIRYAALERCLHAIAERAMEDGASIHMPKVGTGAAGGDWDIIAEMVEDRLVRAGLVVTIYDPPPRPLQLELL